MGLACTARRSQANGVRFTFRGFRCFLGGTGAKKIQRRSLRQRVSCTNFLSCNPDCTRISRWDPPPRIRFHGQLGWVLRPRHPPTLTHRVSWLSKHFSFRGNPRFAQKVWHARCHTRSSSGSPSCVEHDPAKKRSVRSRIENFTASHADIHNFAPPEITESKMKCSTGNERNETRTAGPLGMNTVSIGVYVQLRAGWCQNVVESNAAKPLGGPRNSMQRRCTEGSRPRGPSAARPPPPPLPQAPSNHGTAQWRTVPPASPASPTSSSWART